MNIGPSTTFTSEINDFHSVVDSTVFYTNATVSDPPPPSGPLWFGYDGESVAQTNSTMFFSVNGKELADTVSQGYLTITTDSNSGTVLKNSGYSGAPSHISNHLLSYDETVYISPGTYYMRFQSDQSVPLRMYSFTPDGAEQGFLLTQLTLGLNLRVLLIAGAYSRIGLAVNQITFQCPQTAETPGLIGAETSSIDFGLSPVYMYILHFPTITSGPLVIGHSI